MSFNEWWNNKGFDAVTAEHELSSIERVQALAADAYIQGSIETYKICDQYAAFPENLPTQVLFKNGTRVELAEYTDADGNRVPYLITTRAADKAKPPAASGG